MILRLIIRIDEGLIRGSSLSGSKMADPDANTMKDVSHTPPHGTSAESVWERGRRPAEEEEEEE